jgi:hypothetical protein
MTSPNPLERDSEFPQSDERPDTPMAFLDKLFEAEAKHPYDERRIARSEFPSDSDEKTLIVSTCRVYDGHQPYETAIQDLRYLDGFIPVEAYDTPELARLGHQRWVEFMTSSSPPDSLTDICQTELGAVVVQLNGGQKLTYLRQKGGSDDSQTRTE